MNGAQVVSEGVYKFAQAAAQSGFIPKEFDTPAKVLVVIQMGAELGLGPMQSLQAVAPIRGKLTLCGDNFLGVCQASGELEDIKEYPEGTPYEDDYYWVCTVKRANRRSETRRVYSVRDAKRAGLWGTSGFWKQYPDRALQMRARGFALRDTFPDRTKGFYPTEELLGAQGFETNGGKTTGRVSSVDALNKRLKT